jgi:tryptophan-rich sensory protein
METVMSQRLALPLFLLLTVGGGLAIGAVTAPDAWYQGLAKPSFNPPGWVFGPVWTALYVLIGIAGWRAWRLRSSSTTPMRLWWIQLGLNFAWSPVFFSAHMIGAAFAIILMLLAVLIGFIAVTWRADRTASLLFLPYAAWVAFASVLNGAILVLN